jgi:hypothetical protein
MANPPKAGTRTNTFGPFAQAPNHVVMDSFPNYFTTIDATASPQSSPLTSVSNSVPVAVVIPAAAVSVTIKTDQALRVSEDSAMASYDLIPLGGKETYPCVAPNMDDIIANTGVIYIRSDSTAAKVSFFFTCV